MNARILLLLAPSNRFVARSWRYWRRLGEASSSPARRSSLLVRLKWLASMSMAWRFGMNRSACEEEKKIEREKRGETSETNAVRARV